MAIIRYPFNDEGKGTEIGFLTQTSVRETAPVHTHEYFEIFLVPDGRALHLVNDTVQELEAGSLVWMRPDDVHSYDFYKSFDFVMVNLGFSMQIMRRLTDLFLPEKPFAPLLNAPLPPMVQLSREETAALLRKLQNLERMNREEKPDFVRCQAKGFLASVFCRYFFKESAEEIAAPLWLSSAVLQMQKIENARLGFPRMVELARCSAEHLCREFRKYYDTTPNRFINKQRLGYSLYLLSHSHMEIVEIAEQCGFNNLSHFYHVFKQSFGTSPQKFRRQARPLKPAPTPPDSGMP